ncbi:efflux RND transporter periplasmic adaptor subunit [bacterium]|nr:efflux RND transporter periplasmic adaptor subunit [bacterium]
MRLKLIFVLILIIGLGLGLYRHFAGEKGPFYESVLVKREDIVQKVSATGRVAPAEKVNLAFDIQGRIKKIMVKVGDRVNRGEVLCQLEDEELKNQVLQAEAGRDTYQAQLNKLLAGASKEEIKVYETALENAQLALENARTSLRNAEINLDKVRTDAENKLAQAYQDGLNVLDDSYLKLYNAFNTADLIQRTYFTSNDQEGIKVREAKKSKIKHPMEEMKSLLEKAKEEPTSENIDLALSQAKSSLEKAAEGLAVIRDTCDASVYKNQVSQTDKASLDTQRGYIILALTNVTNAQQAISSVKLANELSIHTAKSQVDNARNALKAAQGNVEEARVRLTQIKSPARKEDIDLIKSQLAQAEAQLSLARERLQKAKLTSPISGIITQVRKKEGEMAAPGEPIISLMSVSGLQIEVEVPEVDIGKVKLGQRAEIGLDAFPDEVFWGSVVKIDPAEEIIQGVVYYKVTIDFDKLDKRIKSGMTADIDIITQEKNNVLVVPARAVISQNDKKMVRVLEGEGFKMREVKTGIHGSEGEIEIISGLKEGERVITFIKSKR